MIANIGENGIKMGISPEMLPDMRQMILIGLGRTLEEVMVAVYLL